MDKAEHDWTIGAGGPGRAAPATGGNPGRSHQQTQQQQDDYYYDQNYAQAYPQSHPLPMSQSDPTQPHHLHPSSPTQSSQARNNYQQENTPRLESGIYDSFLTGYIDLYKKPNPGLATVEDDEAEMASQPGDKYGAQANHFNSDYSQHPPQPPPHSSRNNPQDNYNNNDYYSSAPANYGYDDPHSQQYNHNHHSPYRDSPSPDLHPGMTQQSYNSYNQQQAEYDSPTRAQNRNQYGPAAGAGAMVGASMATSQRNVPDQSYNNGNYTAYGGSSSSPVPRGGDFDQGGRNSPYSPYQNQPKSHNSYSSIEPLTAGAAPLAMSSGQNAGYYGGGAGGNGGIAPQDRGLPNPYRNPYDAHSISRDNLNGMDYIDPNVIADDGDHGLVYQQPKRKSMIGLANNRRSMNSTTALAVGAGVGGVAGAGAAALGNGPGNSSRAMYTPDTELEKRGPQDFSAIVDDEKPKKSNWKRWLFVLLAILILGAIAAGVVLGLMNKNKSDAASSGSSTTPAPGVDGPDMDINSPSVKKLLNNKNLHKVFMGMAYTPMDTQYPNCMHQPPIQNNVTMDLAVIGQLTNLIRLYGTDCNQTEMVLHAIDKLKLKDMRVWVGVWLDNNQTTNTRQIQQLYNILDGPNTQYIKGIVVGNEVLFRKDLTVAQLGQVITDVKGNLTARNKNYPIASSDLGDNWTLGLASTVDYVMSNIHPFFGGIAVDQAASWTWTFWQGHDVILTQGMPQTHVISEVGWPSQGGNDCAPLTKCPDATSGSVAGISQMNQFMNDWVCQSLKNGTEYLW